MPVHDTGRREGHGGCGDGDAPRGYECVLGALLWRVEWWKTKANLGGRQQQRGYEKEDEDLRSRSRAFAILEAEAWCKCIWKFASECNGKINGITSLKIGYESGIKDFTPSHSSILFGGKLRDTVAVSQHT